MANKITNVLICGIFSKTGLMVYNLIKERHDMVIVCGVDNKNAFIGNCDVPVYKSFDEVKEFVEVVVDFSDPSMTEEILSFVTENKCVLIEGTVGYTKKQKETFKKYGEKVAIFMSNYLSLGINTLLKLCSTAAKALGGSYDIEIIEKYYAEKINAPGATTMAIAGQINEALGDTRKIVVGRSSKRKGDEICIHCVRGGNIGGSHDIMFIGKREVLTIQHVTLDSSIYAEGAVEIINFMLDKPNGYYTLKDYYNN